MSEAKHTPGPWAIREGKTPIGGRSCINAVVEARGPDGPETVCMFGGVFGGGALERMRADAHLIAAAPELLEALEMAELMLVEQEDELRRFGAQEPDAESAILTARAAIAKAKGET